MNKKRGPPTSELPTSGMFKNRKFAVSDTAARRSELSAIGVETNKGASMKPVKVGNATQMLVPSSRAATIAAITEYSGISSYANASTQVQDETAMPRVFYSKIGRERLTVKRDANTNGLFVFYSNAKNREETAKHAARQNLAPETARAYSEYRGGAPLEAVDIKTIQDLSFEYLGKPKLGTDERYPTPKEVMEREKFFGMQNNQAGGMEVGGTERGFRTNKNVNAIIHGDAAGKMVFDGCPKDQDVLYFFCTRGNREKLDEKGFTKVNLDTLSGVYLSPGETANHRGTRTANPVELEENPIIFGFTFSEGGGVPKLEDAYDDNGYLVDPVFIKLGRYSYGMSSPQAGFDAKKAVYSMLENLKAGDFNFTLIPVKH